MTRNALEGNRQAVRLIVPPPSALLGGSTCSAIHRKRKTQSMTMTTPSPDDTEFETHILTRVEPSSDGWSLSFDSMGLFVANEHCKVTPQVGEEVLLYGPGFGYTVRGIVIAGRVYCYETPAEHEVSQRQMRERLTREREQRDEAFREAPKPALAAFQVNDAEGWAACVKANASDAYSYCCCRYAAAWASLMESRGELGSTPSAETALKIAKIAKACSHDADTEGITGFMYGAAVSMLAKFWVHGEALRRWHNSDTQIAGEGDRANESGGVLNPALLNIS